MALLKCSVESRDVVKLIKQDKWTISASDESEPVADKGAEPLSGVVIASVKDGNSGGPLLNSRGELVGVILARSVDSKAGKYVAAEVVRTFLKGVE